MVPKYRWGITRIIGHLERDTGGYSDFRLLRLLSHLGGVQSFR